MNIITMNSRFSCFCLWRSCEEGYTYAHECTTTPLIWHLPCIKCSTAIRTDSVCTKYPKQMWKQHSSPSDQYIADVRMYVCCILLKRAYSPSRVKSIGGNKKYIPSEWAITDLWQEGPHILREMKEDPYQEEPTSSGEKGSVWVKSRSARDSTRGIYSLTSTNQSFLLVLKGWNSPLL